MPGSWRAAVRNALGAGWTFAQLPELALPLVVHFSRRYCDWRLARSVRKGPYGVKAVQAPRAAGGRQSANTATACRRCNYARTLEKRKVGFPERSEADLIRFRCSNIPPLACACTMLNEEGSPPYEASREHGLHHLQKKLICDRTLPSLGWRFRQSMLLLVAA